MVNTAPGTAVDVHSEPCLFSSSVGLNNVTLPRAKPTGMTTLSMDGPSAKLSKELNPVCLSVFLAQLVEHDTVLPN